VTRARLDRVVRQADSRPMDRRRALAVLAAPALAAFGACARRVELASAENLDEKFAPGILLEDDKALLPAGEVLRPLHPKGLRLTKASEGWVPKLYNDAAGYCTVGYGHLVYRNRCDGVNPKEFLGGIDEEAGTRLLLGDMERAQTALQLAVRNHPSLLNDLQFAALCDFIFNVGNTNFRESTLLRLIKAKQFDSVPAQLRRWTLAGGKVFEGLKKRREAEIELFFDGQPVPRAIPRADEDLSPLDIRPAGLFR
jgi:lysozyme